MEKYRVFIDWDYTLGENSFERCIISHATESDEEFDGFNIVGRSGDVGSELFISESLEDAIKESKCNPNKIEFYELSDDEIKLKDKIIKDFVWDPAKGIVHTENS